MFISEQKIKFDDNEILLINILLEIHTMGTTAIHRLPINIAYKYTKYR